MNQELMKLSEAIRMNGMVKPQGFGSPSIVSREAPCALGGALQSIGRQAASEMGCFSRVREAWPVTSFVVVDCPVCKYEDELRCVVFHLNDTHEWTRSQIADFVELHEPLPVSQEVEAQEAQLA